MDRHDTLKDGIALPMTLLALVLIGALVTGGLFAAMAEDRSSANGQFGQLAFMAAERGLDDVLGIKNRIYFEDSVGVPGVADTLGPVTLTIDGMQARYTVYVQRLSTRLFKVDSEGRVLSGGKYAGARRRLSQFMRITYTYVPKDRALTTQQPIRLRGASGIRGMDTVPALWDECSDLGSQTAVVSDDTLEIDVAGGIGVGGGLSGTPKKAEDATLDSLKFIEYGDMVLDDLIDVAEKIMTPGTYNGMAPVDLAGICDQSAQLNWGDPINPLGACHLYWPIIYGPGDLHLGNGYGQGILIVAGDLELTGNFEFYGLVFVYGALTSAGTGNKVLGSVNVLGSSAATSELQTDGHGNTKLQLSSCAIDRAHRYNERFSRPIPLSERSFVDISGLGVD